jgi:hypothetical protein
MSADRTQIDLSEERRKRIDAAATAQRKTVVALHRAKALADRLADRSGKPILFTTFTRNLAQAIEGELRLLGGTELLDVVEVLNVDRLSYRVVQEAEGLRPSSSTTPPC